MEDMQVQNEEFVEEMPECTDLITTLPTQTQRFIHLYLTGQYSQAKLAQLLNVHPNTIAKWLKRKDVRAVIHEMQKVNHEVVAMQLRNLTMKALNKLDSLIDSPIDGVALQAVRDVLDRGGHKVKQEIKVDKTVTTIEERMKKLIDKTIDLDEGEYEVIEEEEDDEQ